MKVGFFSESEGVKSSMRLMSFLVFWLLVGIDYLVLERGFYKDKAYDMMFVVFFIAVNLIFLVAVFFPKYLQKIIELGAARFQNIKDAAGSVLPIKETSAETTTSNKQTITETN